MDSVNFDFWTCQVKDGEKTTIKMNSPEDTVHLTMACFGRNVKTHSRTLVNLQYGKREAPICVLIQGKHENQILDLNLPGGKEWSFTISGIIPSTVFLTGYVQPLIDIDQLESLEVEASKAKKRDLENLGEECVKPKKKIKNRKIIRERNLDESLKNEDETLTPKPEMIKEQLKKSQDNFLPKKQNRMVFPIKEDKKKKKKFTFQESGLGIKITKKGTGEKAKKGDTIKVRYIGQLDNETKKVFDKNLAEGFLLKLGGGEVIKGWEEGCQNIQVGEKRKIKIPSKLAYGTESISGIPSNADLLYTVECLEINFN